MVACTGMEEIGERGSSLMFASWPDESFSSLQIERVWSGRLAAAASNVSWPHVIP